jgi:hypothetical protein
MSAEHTRFRHPPLSALRRGRYHLMRQVGLQSRCAHCGLPHCPTPYLLPPRASRECQIPTTYVDCVILSHIPQLYNPYFGHTRHLRPADKHRQNVITWPDRPQFSVRSPCARSFCHKLVSARHAHRQAGVQSDEPDENQASQKHAQPRHASSGSEHTPVSPNALVESDIDPYSIRTMRFQSGSLQASLAISSSRDTTSPATDTTRKVNATAEDDEVARVHSYLRFSRKKEEGLMGGVLFFHRASPARNI